MNKRNFLILSAFVLVLCSTVSSFAQDADKAIPANSKVFVNQMNDDFRTYLVSAFESKKVPLEIVSEKEKADFEITGATESKKAGAAKIIIMGSWHSSEQASISVINLKSGVAVWAYSVNKSNSAHGKRTTAEACAKHLRDKVESKK